MIQYLKMAFRDLARNKRRAFLSAFALGLGLALLLLMSSVVRGEMTMALDNAIHLQTGHLQVRAVGYNEDKTNLAWKDLIENPEALAAQIATLPDVKVATPRLIATGILISGDSSTGVQLIGIDPSSPANDPYRNGLLEGSFVEPGDRDGILIGRRLAEKFKLKAGDTALMNVNTSNGDIAEQLVTIRGVYSTKVPGLDDGVAFMSLEKVQALTQTEKHASTIFILLNDMTATDRVKSQMQTQQYKILTYVDTNELVSQWEAFAGAYMVLMYLIVLGVTATVVVNALVMSVFERTREIGILSAIGMRSSNIMGMFLLESMLLSLGGILIGFILGALFIWYATDVGFYIGSMGVTGIAIGETIYADFALKDGVSLTITALVVTLLASFYPAVMAARMQPVEALRGGKQA